MKDKFEYSKGVIRSRKLTEDKRKRTQNDLHRTTQKTIDCATRIRQ